MFNRSLLVGALVATAGLVLVSTGPATANAGGKTSNPARAVFFAADLNGPNSVPAADPDGRGRAVVRIQGTQVCFALSWSNIAAPTAGHIHSGAAGVNGPVVVPFFAGLLPDTVRATIGCVTSDAATVTAIKANPAGFYVNLHNAGFPAGAIRAQLHALRHSVDLVGTFQGGSSRSLTARLNGAREVPGPGDADGAATAVVRVRANEVQFALVWSGIAPPVAGHIHSGAAGVGGPVVVPFFAAPTGIPATLFAIAGVVAATPEVTAAIARTPGNYYTNLHTAEFPAGAIRGQLTRAHKH